MLQQRRLRSPAHYYFPVWTASVAALSAVAEVQQCSRAEVPAMHADVRPPAVVQLPEGGYAGTNDRMARSASLKGLASGNSGLMHLNFAVTRCKSVQRDCSLA